MFSTTKLMKEKNGPKNLYLYSSQLYINLKNKFALAGNGGSEKGRHLLQMAIRTVNIKLGSEPRPQMGSLQKSGHH